MIGWAILGIAIIMALLIAIAWWCYSDARRNRARLRLALDAHDAEPGAARTGRSVAAIAARVKQERSLADSASRSQLGDGVSVPRQRVAARQRPYINPRPRTRQQPSRPPLPASSLVPARGLPLASTTPPTLALLRRVRDGLEHL